MTPENIIRHLVKYRTFIVAVTIFVFVAVSGYSYFTNGRFYKSGIEFYITGASFTELNSDNKFNNAFPTKQELEIIKNFSNSDQLFLSIVNSFNLVKYYQTNTLQKNFVSEAEDQLKRSTSITIDEQGKISINIIDRDKYQAFNVANAMMKKINSYYNGYLQNFKKRQSIICDKQIDHYTKERKNILNSLSKYPFSSWKIMFSRDSLKHPQYIKQLKQFGMENNLQLTDLMNVIDLFQRLFRTGDLINSYTDQKQNVQLSMYLLSQKKAIINNKFINYNPSVNIISHLATGLQISSIITLVLILLIALFHIYEKEIRLIFKPKE